MYWIELLDVAMNGTAQIAETAIRELERSPSSTQANKSTLIIHSVQRVSAFYYKNISFLT